MTSAPNAKDRIERSTLSSIVTERLREMVIRGDYEAGSQLSEVELADRFGVSRGPIREGLQRLVQEGLLKSIPHRGVFVPVVSNLDIEDLYLAREAIEGAATRVITMSPAHADLAGRLEAIVGEMRKAAGANRWSAVADLDMRFHRELVGSSGSPRLSRMYASLIDETRAILSVTVRYPNRDDLVAEHGDIATHVAAGDIDGALASVARHFEITIESLLRDREPQDGESADPA